ncbi:12S rRNA N4-methylcytidine (m4C) methyltransferase [Halotydeus destructor]|nr:12S rRNA N4-methylcytidine (m4C) methyltransferase [Halotydeus destructor]
MLLRSSFCVRRCITKQRDIRSRSINCQELEVAPATGNAKSDKLSRPIRHLPVLAREVVTALQPKDGEVFLDMTFGGGGHTKHLLATGKDIRVLAVDRDPSAFKRAQELSEKDDRVMPLLGRFSEVPEMLAKLRVHKHSINGVIMDLGASSFQFGEKERGFSYSMDGPLDMRMDAGRYADMATAADVVNTLDSESLAKIFKVYGEEKHAKKYAQAIIDMRFMMNSIRTTGQLSQLINSLNNQPNLDALGRESNAATKVFQALRIFVNNEINELNYALEKIHEYLVYDPRATALHKLDQLGSEENQGLKSGRISVITFHSLEDRVVKRHLLAINIDDPITQTYSQKVVNSLETASEDDLERIRNKKWFPITKHVVMPSEEEVLSNSRSRSAKLRTAIRI